MSLSGFMFHKSLKKYSTHVVVVHAPGVQKETKDYQRKLFYVVYFQM